MAELPTRQPLSSENKKQHFLSKKVEIVAKFIENL